RRFGSEFLGRARRVQKPALLDSRFRLSGRLPGIYFCGVPHNSTASQCERPSRARLFLVLASLLFASSVCRGPTQGQTALRVVGSDSLEVDALPGFAYQLQQTPSLDSIADWASVGRALTSEAPGVLSWPITT